MGSSLLFFWEWKGEGKLVVCAHIDFAFFLWFPCYLLDFYIGLLWLVGAFAGDLAGVLEKATSGSCILLYF